MKCEFCKDPILKSQETRTRIDRDGKILKYHKGCFELWLDKIVEKVKSDK